MNFGFAKKKKKTQKLSSTVHFFYPAPIKGKGMLRGKRAAEVAVGVRIGAAQFMVDVRYRKGRTVFLRVVAQQGKKGHRIRTAREGEKNRGVFRHFREQMGLSKAVEGAYVLHCSGSI